jgi:hypothetical protein
MKGLVGAGDVDVAQRDTRVVLHWALRAFTMHTRQRLYSAG